MSNAAESATLPTERAGLAGDGGPGFPWHRTAPPFVPVITLPPYERRHIQVDPRPDLEVTTSGLTKYSSGCAISLQLGRIFGFAEPTPGRLARVRRAAAPAITRDLGNPVRGGMLSGNSKRSLRRKDGTIR